MHAFRPPYLTRTLSFKPERCLFKVIPFMYPECDLCLPFGLRCNYNRNVRSAGPYLGDELQECPLKVLRHPWWNFQGYDLGRGEFIEWQVHFSHHLVQQVGFGNVSGY